MNYGIYSVYDTKSNVYAQPFYAPNRAVALRHFNGAKEDEQSIISKYPGDFVLYELGVFDDNAGTIQISTNPQPISGV